MQELKIFIYEENGKLFSQIGDFKEEFKFPEQYWRVYEKNKKIEDTHWLPV